MRLLRSLPFAFAMLGATASAAETYSKLVTPDGVEYTRIRDGREEVFGDLNKDGQVNYKLWCEGGTMRYGSMLPEANGAVKVNRRCEGGTMRYEFYVPDGNSGVKPTPTTDVYRKNLEEDAGIIRDRQLLFEKIKAEADSKQQASK